MAFSKFVKRQKVRLLLVYIKDRIHSVCRNVCARFRMMVPRRRAASAKNLIVRQTESATGTLVTEIEIRTGTGGTGTATVTVTTATANGKGTGTGTEIMTVTVTGIATAAVNGTENVTGIVRRRETVGPGTTGMTTTHDGHRVTTDVNVNGAGTVTRRGTVVSETEIDMVHEEQVLERRTGNGVQEGTERKTEEATMSPERNERERTRSEVRKCDAFQLSKPVSLFLTAMHRGQDTMQKPLQPRTERVALKRQRRGRYDTFT